MEVKTNNATINRPEGERLVDAPAVLVKLDELMEQLKDEKAWDKNDRNAITVFKSEGLTIVLSAFHKKAEIPDLELEGMITIQVLKGRISLSNNEDEQALHEKEMMVLHSSTPHRLVAEKETVLLLSAIKMSK